jgi:simple sugar transport system permease protein
MKGDGLYAGAVAALAALAVASLLILAYGSSPLEVYRVMLARTWGDEFGTGQVLYRATLLVFTGLSVAVAFQAGLFNIGAEGQLLLGSFACGVVGAALPGSFFSVATAAMAAVVAGAALGALAGWLKARFGAHEVITTIMLNFIAGALVLVAARAWFFQPESVHTARVGAMLPSLGLAGSAASAAFPLALAAALGCFVLLRFTRAGYELRAAGRSPDAATAAGVAAGRVTVATMALSGGLAGLVGAATVLGNKGWFEKDLGAGAGFMGIAVALLGRASPIGVVVAALLFGTLAEGSLAASQLVPKEMVDVLTGVVILTVATLGVKR